MGVGHAPDSTRSFPRAMTLGATRNEALVRMFGQVVGQSPRHGRACQLRPCGRRQLQPDQPGDWQPQLRGVCEWVSKLGQAYADGLQDQRKLATAKHFPGHGDSDSDSHHLALHFARPRAVDSVEWPVPTRLRPRHGRGDGRPLGRAGRTAPRPNPPPFPPRLSTPCCGKRWASKAWCSQTP